MTKEPKTKCSEVGFKHNWKEITDNIVYATNPPTYPQKKEQCINCGLTRTYCKRIEEWFEYKQEKLVEHGCINITSLTNLTDCTSTGGNTLISE